MYIFHFSEPENVVASVDPHSVELSSKWSMGLCDFLCCIFIRL